MYCFKCGNELLEDSVFCNKCGEKVQIVATTQQKSNRFEFIKRIASITRLNLIITTVFVIIAIIGFNMIQKNTSNIGYQKELVRIQKDQVELVKEHPFLGSIYSEEENLKEYQSQLYGKYAIITVGFVMIAISLIVIVYMAFYMFKLIKKRREVDNVL